MNAVLQHPSWAGVYTRGKHFTEGPFEDDHWIIIRDFEAGRDAADIVLTSSTKRSAILWTPRVTMWTSTRRSAV